MDAAFLGWLAVIVFVVAGLTTHNLKLLLFSIGLLLFVLAQKRCT